MTIAEAKQQIINAMRAYFKKDEYGSFILPPASQRPVFLMGPPGIGKTAIMSEIASELGVGLLSYSMTHHTRQSALGLPVITDKSYGKTTEYTVSEIIASVYELMEQSGVKEGILFLDEINCVSETLTPVMLQLLQFKTFGRHAVPEGWIVVTAGNPPEYNRSAREFDIVTWDRLKRIDVEPDYPAWKAYARKKGVHASVLSYLDVKKENFYRIESTPDGKSFVTARGWDDLSDMIKLSESLDIEVDIKLISQYLQNREVAEDFARYYDLFRKYREDYHIDEILSGSSSDEICQRAKNAEFDERLSLLGLLLDSVNSDMRAVIRTQDTLTELREVLLAVKSGESPEEKLAERKEELGRLHRRGAASRQRLGTAEYIIAFLNEHVREASDFAAIKADFDSRVSDMKKCASEILPRLESLFAFAEKVWRGGQELLILVTELSADPYSARFISRYGCDSYYRHSDELMFHERRTEIIKELEQLEEEI